MRSIATQFVAVIVFVASSASAAVVWQSDFTSGPDGVVDLFDGNPGKVMIGPASGGRLQITTWDSTALFNGDKAGRPLGATRGGGESFSGLYEFNWSSLNTEQTIMWEFVGFLGNDPNQSRQVCGAILRHWRIPDGRYWVAVDVAFGGAGLTAFGFNAGSPILLGTNPLGTDYKLAIGYDGTTHVLGLHFFSNSGSWLGGQRVDLDTDVSGLQGGATGDPAQEIASLAVTHLGWGDYTANGMDRETVWQVNRLTYHDTADGAFLAAGGTPDTVGACCLGTGLCADARTQQECSDDGGTWQGADSICTASNCDQDAGACCWPDDTCTEVRFSECFGVWKGEGTSCATESCPPPFVDPNADEPWEVWYTGLDTAADHVPPPLKWDRIIDDDWDEPDTSYRLNFPFPGFLTVDRVSNPAHHNRTGNFASRDPNLNHASGLTVEARLLIRENSQLDSVTINNLDDAGSVGVQLSPNRAKVGQLPPLGNGTIVNLDTTDAFHLYRMVRLPNSFEVRLYVDNNPAPVAVGTGQAGFYVDSNGFLLWPQVMIGDNSNDPNVNGSFVVDFVRYRRGATAPGEAPPVFPTRVLPALPPEPDSPETWTVGYDGNGTPGTLGWIQGGSASAWTQQPDGIMELNTLDSPAGARMEDPVIGWTNQEAITLEARIKVLPDSQERAFNLVLNDQTNSGSILLSTDKVELSHAYLPGGFATVPMNTTNDFHVYRITRGKRVAGHDPNGLYWYLYIDDNPEPVIMHQKGGGHQLPYARIWWGDVAYPIPENGCHVLIDYIRWHEGSNAPIPTCNNPVFDADGDGDCDQDDFGVFQDCLTGADDPTGIFDPEKCACFDRDSGGLGDQDIDALDLIAFMKCLSGAGVPADPACDN